MNLTQIFDSLCQVFACYQRLLSKSCTEDVIYIKAEKVFLHSSTSATSYYSILRSFICNIDETEQKRLPTMSKHCKLAKIVSPALLRNKSKSWKFTSPRFAAYLDRKNTFSYCLLNQVRYKWNVTFFLAKAIIPGHYSANAVILYYFPVLFPSFFFFLSVST